MLLTSVVMSAQTQQGYVKTLERPEKADGLYFEMGGKNNKINGLFVY